MLKLNSLMFYVASGWPPLSQNIFAIPTFQFGPTHCKYSRFYLKSRIMTQLYIYIYTHIHKLKLLSYVEYYQMGDVAKDLTSGTVGGAAQLICGHPFDTIKVKLQSQPASLPGQLPKYSGAMDAVKQTVSAEGAKGLYKGIENGRTFFNKKIFKFLSFFFLFWV